MHLLGPRPSRNPDLSVQPTYYLFIRTVPGWSATWRNRLREFAELAFLARVPSELCLHSFRFGSLLFSASSFQLVRSSVSFPPSHPRRFPPPLADLPSNFFELAHTHTHTHIRAFSHIPTHPLFFFFSIPDSISVVHRAAISFLPSPLVEHPLGTRSMLTCGLLCNQNNNNCFETLSTTHQSGWQPIACSYVQASLV